MADEQGGSKTEQPTPKRLRDAKEKGQVIQSKDITQISVTIMAFALCIMLGGWMVETLKFILIFPTEYFGKPFDFSLAEVVSAVMFKSIQLSLIFTGILALTAIFATIMHQGVTFAPEKLKIKMETLNPVNGAKNLFSKKSLFEVIKSIIKSSLYASFFMYIIIDNMQDIVLTPQCGINCLIAVTLKILIEFMVFIIFIGVIIAIIDYLMQKRIYTKELMMTKDEVKREHKDVEGNPEIKKRRKEIHREIIESQGEKVGTSDVLVTNPTHITIGIMFKRGKTPLPIITLKAADNEALICRQIGKDMNIPVFENIPLAHALWEDAEVERFIPQDLFEPVAQILSWVESMKGDG